MHRRHENPEKLYRTSIVETRLLIILNETAHDFLYTRIYGLFLTTRHLLIFTQIRYAYNHQTKKKKKNREKIEEKHLIRVHYVKWTTTDLTENDVARWRQ